MLSNHNVRQMYLACSLNDCLEDEKLSDIEKFLSINNADPNILIPEKGIAPFHLAIGNENVKFALDVTKLFLKYGGDPNVRTDDGLTPVHIAAAWGRYDILAILLENGGDPDLVDDEEMSAECYAIEEGHENILDLLKSFRKDTVDGEHKSKQGFSLALDKVVISNGDDFAEYFVSKEEINDIAYLKSLEHNPSNYVTEWCQKHNNINKFNEEYDPTLSIKSIKNSDSNLEDKKLEIKKNDSNLEDKKSFVKRWSARFLTAEKSLNANEPILIQNIKTENTSNIDPVNSVVVSSGSEEYETCSEQKDNLPANLITTIASTENQIKDGNKSTVCLYTDKDEMRDAKSVQSNLMANNYCDSNITYKQNNFIKSEMVMDNNYSLMTADFSIITPDHSSKHTSKTYNIFNSTVVKCLNQDSNNQKSPKVKSRQSIILSGVVGNKLIQNDISKENCSQERSTKDKQASSKLLKSTKKCLLNSPKINTEKEVDKYGTYKTPSSNNRITEESDKYGTCKRNAKSLRNAYAIESSDKYGTYKIYKKPSENHPVINTGLLSVADKVDQHGNECLVQLSEEYRYTDNEEGVVLIEKRILRTTVISSSDEGSFSGASSVTLPNCIDYDTDNLRAELTTLGLNPGPITKTTKRIYLKKLMKCRKKPQIILPPTEERAPYSVELEKTIRNPNWYAELKPYLDLEKAIAVQFATPDPKKRWREGVQKSSFTYLLLDPRITDNLPGRVDTLNPEEKWKTFLSSVFYVGKGKRSRPFSHLYQAVGIWNKGLTTSADKKVQYILDIWKEQLGVVCLHVFQNVIPVEAFTREAAMIDCLTLKNLKNSKLGDYYGIASTWPHKQKRQLGVYLLYRAMQIFINEGERQLKPPDIAH